MGTTASVEKGDTNDAPITAIPDGGLDHLMNLLERLDSSLDDQVRAALLNHPDAVESLRRWGYVHEEEAHEALLPPELQNFVTLQEEKDVAAALNNPAFGVAQKEAQQKTKTTLTSALEKLRAEIKPVSEAYLAAIKRRAGEEGMKATCREVIRKGNENFSGVYVFFLFFLPFFSRQLSHSIISPSIIISLFFFFLFPQVQQRLGNDRQGRPRRMPRVPAGAHQCDGARPGNTAVHG